MSEIETPLDPTRSGNEDTDSNSRININFKNQKHEVCDFVLDWFSIDKKDHQIFKWWKLYNYFLPGLILFIIQFTLFPFPQKRNCFLALAWIMLFIGEIFLNLFPFSLNMYIWLYTFGITSTYYLIARENPAIINTNSTMVRFAGFDLLNSKAILHRTSTQLTVSALNLVAIYLICVVVNGIDTILSSESLWICYSFYNLATIGFTSMFLPTITPYIYGTNMDRLHSSQKLRNYLEHPSELNSNEAISELKIFKRDFKKIKAILTWLEGAQILCILYVSTVLYMFFTSSNGDIWNRLGSGSSRLIYYLGRNYYIGLLIFFIAVEVIINTLKIAITYFANLKSDLLENDFKNRLDILSNVIAFPLKAKFEFENLGIKELTKASSYPNIVLSQGSKDIIKLSPYSRIDIAREMKKQLSDQIKLITENINEEDKMIKAALSLKAQMHRVKTEYLEASEMAGYKFLGFFRVDIKLISQIVMVGVTSILTFVFSSLLQSPSSSSS